MRPTIIVVWIATALWTHGAWGQGVAPDLDRYYLTPCDPSQQKQADCVLHITCAIDGVGKTTQDLYFRRQPLSKDWKQRMGQQFGNAGGHGANFNGDGVSKKTGGDIGLGGGCSVVNIQPDGIVVSIHCHWTTDADHDSLHYYLVCPYDRTFETRIKKLSATGTFEWIHP